MFNITPQELILILVVALLVVGPRRLPELGRSIGKGLREIRKAQEEVRRTVRLDLDEADRPAAGARAKGEAPPEETSPAPAASPGDATGPGVAEISKTLGRGLGELRRARREVERTFRVDLNEASPSPGRPRPATPVPAPPRDVEPDASGVADEGERPA